MLNFQWLTINIVAQIFKHRTFSLSEMVRFSILKWRRRFSCFNKQRQQHLPPRRHCRIMSLQSGKLLCLTQKDVKQIKKSWKNISNYDKWAQSLFLKMCEHKPIFKKAFGYDEDVELKIIEISEKLQNHSRHFVEFWQRIVTNLRYEHDFGKPEHHEEEEDDDEEDYCRDIVVSKIRQLGRQHAQNRLIRFDADTWLFFKRCIIDSFCDCQETNLHNKTCLAWTKLLNFVVSEMKNAFHEGVRSRNDGLDTTDVESYHDIFL